MMPSVSTHILYVLYPVVLLVMCLAFFFRSTRFGFWHHLGYGYLMAYSILILSVSEFLGMLNYLFLVFVVSLYFLHVKSALGKVLTFKGKLPVLVLLCFFITSCFLPVSGGGSYTTPGHILITEYIYYGSFIEDMVLLPNVIFFMLLSAYFANQQKRFSKYLLTATTVMLITTAISYLVPENKILPLDQIELNSGFYLWVLAITFMVFIVLTSAFTNDKKELFVPEIDYKNLAGRRFLAFLIDSILFSVMSIPVMIFALNRQAETEYDMELADWSALLFSGLFLALSWIVYHAEFERRKGWTPGKYVLGLRVAAIFGFQNSSLYRRSVLKYLCSPFNFIATVFLLMGLVGYVRMSSGGSIGETFIESGVVAGIVTLTSGGLGLLYLLFTQRFLHDKLSGYGIVEK